jgi:bis(5'-nucleosyl)-tetraphosphatase (symmetrical)
MAVYAIGDVQGCYQELLDLLELIQFDKENDRLWLTGDVVNRGPESLKTLRLVIDLNAIMILGNHEFHLLAIAAGVIKSGKKDTLNAILEADDCDKLINWLHGRPLLHHDKDLGFVMTHAGLPPQWDLNRAETMAGEVESILQSEKASEFLKNLYGDKPDLWDEKLTGWERLRYTVNALTRMRYCNAEGRLNFSDKGPPGSQSGQYQPWFIHKKRLSSKNKLIFGHWASLYLDSPAEYLQFNIFPLDTGCVWGRKLTAMRLGDQKFFDVPSRQKLKS